MFSSSVSFGFWDWSGLVGLWVDDADVGSTKLRSSLTGSRGGFDFGDGMYEWLGIPHGWRSAFEAGVVQYYIIQVESFAYFL